MSVTAEEMAERALTYKVLGRFYLDAFTQEELDELEPEVFNELAQNSETELARKGYDHIFRSLRHKNTATCQELRADFTQTFLGAHEYLGMAAIPHESQYLAYEGEGLAQVRIGVARVYRENNMSFEPEIDLPADHLAYEMEFMAVTSKHIAINIEDGDMESALHGLDVQASFLDEHIMLWFGRFYSLANNICSTRFYKGVLDVTASFLEEDRKFIDDMKVELEN